MNPRRFETIMLLMAGTGQMVGSFWADEIKTRDVSLPVREPGDVNRVSSGVVTEFYYRSSFIGSVIAGRGLNWEVF